MIKEETTQRIILGCLRALFLVVGVSWIYSVIRLDIRFGFLGGSDLFMVARHLALVISLTLMVMAVRPSLLRPLLGPKSGATLAFSVLLLVAAGLWQWSLVDGPMMGKFLDNPFTGQAKGAGLLFSGGVFFHIVIQHWLISAVGVLLAVYPQGFRALIAPEVPVIAPGMKEEPEKAER